MAKWITFKHPIQFAGNRPAITGLCVEGPKGEELARKMGEVLAVDSLPYPADPRINSGEDSCPSFCFEPRVCKGRTSCPRNYACSE